MNEKEVQTRDATRDIGAEVLDAVRSVKAKRLNKANIEPVYPVLVGDPNDPDLVDWDEAERTGLPILRHADEFDDAL